MIKPLGNMILVEKEAAEEKKTSSGLVIAAGIADNGLKRGKVIDIGDGEYNYRGDLIPVNGIDLGDMISYQDHAAIEIDDTDGKKYYLINMKNVLAKIEG